MAKVVSSTPEARQQALIRMLTENPKVKLSLTGGQKAALSAAKRPVNGARPVGR